MSHNPKHQFDCGNCKFNWCCGPCCYCNLKKSHPPAPDERIDEVAKLRREAGYGPAADELLKTKVKK